jgi:transcriptional regulator with XRE-family HTH domain
MYVAHMNKLADRIRAIRKAHGLNQTEFAEAVGATQSTVTRWEKGSIPNGQALQKIADFANTTVERLMGTDDLAATPGNMIPVVGFVGAGASILPYDDFPKGDGLDHVERPPFVKGQVVAVEVRGDSLLPVAENGWRLIYAGDQSLVDSEILNRLCVVQLTDGRAMVKRVMRGSQTGCYHLLSTNAPMIENAQLEWAAPVKAIIPA